MKAKFINEDGIKDILKPKSEEEWKEHLKPGEQVPGDILAIIINSTEIGYDIKVNFDGAWDRFGPIRKAWVSNINQGNGFETGLFVNSDNGTFLYAPPFKLESLPDDKNMLLFYASQNSIYIDKII